ncbi:MAG: hypothetical protein J0L93_05590 [Deltaproteobacteria bacterium]|nr:hypothetical protein [Deltaproteobacteria bacterium]
MKNLFIILAAVGILAFNEKAKADPKEKPIENISQSKVQQKSQDLEATPAMIQDALDAGLTLADIRLSVENDHPLSLEEEEAFAAAEIAEANKLSDEECGTGICELPFEHEEQHKTLKIHNLITEEEVKKMISEINNLNKNFESQKLKPRRPYYLEIEGTNIEKYSEAKEELPPSASQENADMLRPEKN